MRNRLNIRSAVVVSFGLHLLIPLFLTRCDQVVGWIEPADLQPPEKNEPIVFELVDPSPGAEPDEVPETNLVSTKKSLAHSDEAAVAQAANNLPASAGESPLKENRHAGEAAERDEPVRPAEEERPDESRSEGEDSPKSLLSPSNIRNEVSRSLEGRRFQNPRGTQSLPGDLSFNTVDFEFAPYLFELKKRIEEKWYPPVASYGRGFKGESVVRFAVAKGGELDLLELLSGADHTSLDTAAMNAVRYGAPFPPLPEDFPEERWVITCTFYYR